MNTNTEIINRDKFPPGGWQFLEVATGWRPPMPGGSSFTQTVNQIIQHRIANGKHGKAIAFGEVASELDAFTCARLEGDPAWCQKKKSSRLASSHPQTDSLTLLGRVVALAGKVRSIAGGAATLAEWTGEGQVPVSDVQAQGRADTCFQCPYNIKGMAPVSGAVAQAVLEHTRLKNHMELRVKDEALLGTCSRCGCHLPLKVWVPIKHIRDTTRRDDFPNYCWVAHEKTAEENRAALRAVAKELAFRPFSDVSLPPLHEQTGWPSGIFAIPITPGDVWFNPGLVKRDDGLWLAARHVRNGNNGVVFWPLNPDMSIRGAGVRVEYNATIPGEHFEDPRCIELPDGSGHQWMAVTNFVIGSYAHMAFFRLDRTLKVVDSLRVVFGGNAGHIMMNTAHEKNWQPFHHEGEFHAVYSIQPHVVIKLDETHGTVLAEHRTENAAVAWPWGDLRGGTPPVLVGDEYVSFYHSSRQWKGPKRRYFMGAYAFEAKPPFRITRFTAFPLAIGSENDPMVSWSPLVVFPCGALLNDGVWTITYGINDAACGWMRIPHDELLNSMASASRLVSNSVL